MQEIINNAKTAIGNLIGDMDEYGDGTTPLSEAVKTRAKFIDYFFLYYKFGQLLH